MSVQDRAALGGAAADLNVHCASLAERGVEARAAAFVSTSAGSDTSRLATEQDVDLILVSAGLALLDDPDLGELLRTAPCDVGIVVGDGPRAWPRPRPVRRRRARLERDRARCLARRQLGRAAPDRGARRRGRSVTRVACSRAPRSPFSARSVLRRSRSSSRRLQWRSSRRAQDAAIAVVGLSDRWRKDGLGPTRGALAVHGTAGAPRAQGPSAGRARAGRRT